MLTAKENMREVIRGGNPDRLPNSYEALRLLVHPLTMFGAGFPQKGGPDVVNDWGVTYLLPLQCSRRLSCPHPGQDCHQGHRKLAGLCESPQPGFHRGTVGRRQGHV